MLTASLANSTIGTDSCNGYYACYGLTNAKIGDRSCTGNAIVGPDGYTGSSCGYLHGEIDTSSLSLLTQEYVKNTEQTSLFKQELLVTTHVLSTLRVTKEHMITTQLSLETLAVEVIVRACISVCSNN